MNVPMCQICMTDKVETDPDNATPHLRWSCRSKVCEDLRSRPMPESDGPSFNIHHLKRQNREGSTTASEVREVLENVSPERMEQIDRAR